MRYRYCFLLCCAVIAAPVMADICPSVNDLKTNKKSNWKAYDSEDNKPLTHLRETKLKQAIKHFALAEWHRSTTQPSVRCYYKTENGSHLDAYFTKESVASIRPSKYWYQVTGMMQCAAKADKCAFQSLPAPQHQLASNQLNH